MAKLTKMTYFCSFRGNIEYENLLELQKAAEKFPTGTNYLFFYLLSSKLGWLAIIRRVGFFIIFTNWGGDRNKLKSKEQKCKFVKL